MKKEVVFQEALTNIGKHAQPTAVIISCPKEQQRSQLVVEDNGRGFNAEVLGSWGAARGLGLVAMEERLNMVGGVFQHPEP